MVQLSTNCPEYSHLDFTSHFILYYIIKILTNSDIIDNAGKYIQPCELCRNEFRFSPTIHL